MKSSLIVLLIGLVFGGALIAIGVLRPAFAWNYDMVVSIRDTLGDTITAIFLIAAGIASIGSSLLTLRSKPSGQ